MGVDARKQRPSVPWSSAMSRTAIVTFLLAGCGGGELAGQYFDVTAKGAENLCTGSGTDYTEQLIYRLVVEGNSLQVAVEDDVFATGTIEGCSLSYSSIVWSDYRDEKEIKWQIIGSARANLGGGAGCVPDGDWEGDEQFVVITSEHDEVQPGCTYDLTMTGKFNREVDPGAEEGPVDPVQ
jgi:hypothetical protein